MSQQTNRIELHNLLVTTLETNNVYFQPPSNIQMKYPCVIYSRSKKDEKFADDALYLGQTAYTVIVVDSDPDSSILDKITKLPFSRFDRHYVSDDLNHDVFTIYH